MQGRLWIFFLIIFLFFIYGGKGKKNFCETKFEYGGEICDKIKLELIFSKIKIPIVLKVLGKNINKEKVI